MRGKQWPKSKQIEVLESYALSGSLAATSRETGVPKTTIKRWIDADTEVIERIRKRNEEIRERAVEETMEEMAKRHSALGQRMQEAGEALLDKIRRPTAGAVASLIKGGVDIERLAAGEPTDRHEMNVWEKIIQKIEEGDDGRDGPSYDGFHAANGR